MKLKKQLTTVILAAMAIAAAFAGDLPEELKDVPKGHNCYELYKTIR